MHVLKVSDIPAGYTVRSGQVIVQLTKQRTGFGYRRYFICPSCGRKCGKLYVTASGLYCQCCTPLDPYKTRRNLYDEDSARLIAWHMDKLVATISDTRIEYPFNYFRYPIDPPQGISRRKYRETLLRLQIMENMRHAALCSGYIVTAADIRKYTSKNFINLFELWLVADYQIFGTEIPPEYYAFLIDEDSAPPIPPFHTRPAEIKLRDPDRIRQVMAKYNLLE